MVQDTESVDECQILNIRALELQDFPLFLHTGVVILACGALCDVYARDTA